MPRTASAAPASTALFAELDLDLSSAQWQQAEELLARVGLPDALDLWRNQMLQKGERKGDFGEADLDALLGGEVAVVVGPGAMARMAAMHMEYAAGEATPTMTDETPIMTGAAEPQGVAAILLPGDPDAAWAYAKRQLASFASERNGEIKTQTDGDVEIIRLQVSEETSGAMSGDDSHDPYDAWFGHHKGNVAVGRAGDFIIAASTTADVEQIADVVDGSSPSLADSSGAQVVASSLPADSLAFTYVDGKTILGALGPQANVSMQRMLPPGMTVESLGGAVGFALSADQPGFRFDSVAMPGEGGNLASIVAVNSPAVADAARRAPAGSFLFDAGILPKNAFAGLPLAFSQAVNGVMSGASGLGGEQNGFPTAAEIEAEIAQAAATLGFDPRADLFDLLGNELIAFTNFPNFGGGGFGLNAAAAVGTSDAATLTTTAQKLAAWLERTVPGASVSTRQVGGDTVYAVSDSEAKGMPALEFGVVDDRAVIGVGDGIDELQSSPATSLADDARFQQVMATLPSDYSQVAYVDLSQLTRLAMMFTGAMAGAGEATPVATAGSLLNLQAFGAVTYQQDGKAGTSAILYIAEPGT